MSQQRFIGFSESGLLNALVHYLTRDLKRTRKFLRGLDFRSAAANRVVADLAKDLTECTFFVEPGLGEFGIPDVVIVARAGEAERRLVFFVEMKAKSYVDSAASNRKGFKGRNFGSFVNGQLSMRYRFARTVARWDANATAGLVEPAEVATAAAQCLADDFGRSRHLRKPEVLAGIVFAMRPDTREPEAGFLDRVFYAAVTEDRANPFKAPDTEANRDLWPCYPAGAVGDPFAADAWARTGWCGWPDIETALEGLRGDQEYKLALPLSLDPVRAKARRGAAGQETVKGGATPPRGGRGRVE